MLIAITICLIVSVSDGDTLTARCGAPGSYEQVKIRLGGIDAPESRQPYGQRSRQHLSALCYKVKAKIAPKGTDRYKRTIADVECRDKDAGTEQIRAGMAWVYWNDDKGYQHLYPLQDKAAEDGEGLWHPGNAVAPWAWRKGVR